MILARILSRAAPLARRGFSLRAVVIALPKTKTGRPRRASRVSCDPICNTKTARPATVCRAVSRPVCGLQAPVCGAGAGPSGAAARLGGPDRPGGASFPAYEKTGAPWPPSSLCIESRVSVYFGRGPAPPFNPPVPVGAQTTTWIRGTGARCYTDSIPTQLPLFAPAAGRRRPRLVAGGRPSSRIPPGASPARAGL